MHVGKFFARNLGGLIRARTCAGPAREGNSLPNALTAPRWTSISETRASGYDPRATVFQTF